VTGRLIYETHDPGPDPRARGTDPALYRVVENDSYSLVGADGGTVYAPEIGTTTSVDALIINKSTGELVLGSVSLKKHEPDSGWTVGDCHKT
jgi:hypothetical protein